MTYETENPFGTYDSDGLSPQDLLARLTALQSRLNSTISHVDREDGILKEKQSQISQDIDSISLTVSNIETDLNGTTERVGSLEVRADGIDLQVSNVSSTVDGNTANISSLSLRADGIETNVAALDSRIGAAETSITQNAGEIQLRASVDYVDSAVNDLDLRISSAESSITQNANNIALKVSQTDYTGNYIVESLINQTATTIKLKASKIELDGITQVNGNLLLGAGWEPGGTNGAKSITFSNAGKISYNDGFLYSATTFGHLFRGNVTIDSGYSLNLNGVTVNGLNTTVSFG